MKSAGARLRAISGRLRGRWSHFRERKALSLLFDAALILAVFFAIHAWQTRDLPVDEIAPETVLALLDGGGPVNALRPVETGIVYFLAPWRGYCKVSIDNLDNLVADGAVAWGTAVALDYGDSEAVQDFVKETGIALPVLMGNRDTATDWSVRGFPTYYVIDAEGRIASRSVGYSTWLGMRLRAWRANM